MTAAHVVVLILLVIGIAVGVHGIRMERRAKRKGPISAHHPCERISTLRRPTYDDMARELAVEREFTRIRREHIDNIRAAEVHE